MSMTCPIQVPRSTLEKKSATTSFRTTMLNQRGKHSLDSFSKSLDFIGGKLFHFF
jgi:hypothetical protein